MSKLNSEELIRLKAPCLFLLLCLLFIGCGKGKKISQVVPPSTTDSLTNNPSVDISSIGQFHFPVKGRVISPFGNHRRGHYHTGTDIKLQHGDTVRAAFDGLVTKAGPYYGYGNLVILKHTNNMETYYAHLSRCLVSVGNRVNAGDVVGLGGRTGHATTDHLHFELRFNNIPQNPETYFDFRNLTVRTPVPEYIPLKIEHKIKAGSSFRNSYIVIHHGDTLYSIAKRYKTSVGKLRRINHLANADLKIGMKLKLR